MKSKREKDHRNLTGKMVVIALFLLFILTPSIGRAANVSLSWGPVSHPLLTGYKLHYGTQSGAYTTHVGAGNTTSYTVTGLSTGVPYYFAVTAYGSDGSESSYSNEVSTTLAASDTTSPTVSIVYPTGSTTYSTTNSAISLSGTASDNVAVTRVTWSNDRGGSGTATGTTSWSVGSVALQTGTNTVTVTAYDAAGNSRGDTVQITRVTTQSPPQTVEPETVDGFLIWGNQFGNNLPGGTGNGYPEGVNLSFEGHAGDHVLVYEVYDVDRADEVHILLNGQEVGYAPMTGGNVWSGTIIVLLPDDMVNNSGLNTLRFDQTLSNETWGVRNMVVTPARPLPSTATVGNFSSADEYVSSQATFYFQGKAGQVDILFSAYDVDSADEMAVLINGETTDYALTTGNNSWGNSDTLVLLDGQVRDSSLNVVSFVNTTGAGDAEPWGVRNVTVSGGAAVAPGQATTRTPLGKITTSRPTFTWNSVSGATLYRLEVRDRSGVLVYSKNLSASGVTSGAACSTTPTDILPNSTYRWRVQAGNNVGYGYWSTYKMFTVASTGTASGSGSGATQPVQVPGQATTISPLGKIITTIPTFSWNKVNGATLYVLEVRNQSGVLVYSKNLSSTSLTTSGATCSTTPSNLLQKGATYKWRLRTGNSAGSGPWSTYKMFTIAK